MRNVLLTLIVLLVSCRSGTRTTGLFPEKAPAPLFRDPVFDGAADPSAIYNRNSGEWLIFYTQRRARLELRGTEYCYGTAVGIAASKDGGASWQYKGAAKLPQPDSGLNSFWAPQVFRNPDDDSYHMIVSYIQGVHNNWGGERQIFHYKSGDLEQWERIESAGTDGCIDASVAQLPDGTWKMWFKDEQRGSFTYSAVSKDLITWTRTTFQDSTGKQVFRPEVFNRHHEAPVIFRWKNSWWMITDPTYEEYTGLDVFRSDDAAHWVYNNTILETPGMRPDDNDQGRHADVQVVNDRAVIIYFTHPGRIYDQPGINLPNLPRENPDGNSLRYRRSSLQIAELELQGNTIICNRDKFALTQP